MTSALRLRFRLVSRLHVYPSTPEYRLFLALRKAQVETSSFTSTDFSIFGLYPSYQEVLVFLVLERRSFPLKAASVLSRVSWSSPWPVGHYPEALLASGMDIDMKYGCALLADNHPTMLEGARSLLEDLFTVVVMVADEASLFEAITKMTPDLVVVDLSLPVCGSCNIMRQLNRRYPGLKVIVLSVHDERAAVEASVAAGVAGFVLKRTAGTDLVRAVQTVLSGGTYVSPAVRSGST